MKRQGSPLAGVGAGSIVAALLLLAVAVSGLMSVGDPATSEEAGHRLAAESLARDGDLVLSTEDENRMRLGQWAGSVRPRLTLSDNGALRFERPWFYPLLLAPFARLSPAGGTVVVNVLLLLVTLVVSAGSVRRRTGESGSWTVIAVVFGSAVAAYVSASQPTLMLVAATATALALFAASRAVAGEALQEMYPEDVGRRGVTGRALVGGFLLGVVAAHHPLYLLLFAAPAAMLPPRRRSQGMTAAAIGGVLALAIVWPVSGLWPELAAELELWPGKGQRVEVSVGEGPTGVEKVEIFEQQGRQLSMPSLHLLAWNSLYALTGSHVGVLPYFSPLLLLLLAWRGRSEGGAFVAIAVVALVASMLIWPFSFAGLPSAIGNSLFVPFYVLLWWLPVRPLGLRGALVALAVGGVLLWRLWVPGEAPLERLQAGHSRGWPLELLPYETTQRELPVHGEVVTRDLLVRPMGGVEPGGRQGHFRLPTSRRADLLIAAPQTLRSIELEFDAAAGTSLEVDGGEATDMILTPRGGVAFRVRLLEGRVRHPVWWSQKVHTFYRLGLAMPDAAGSTTFSISESQVHSATPRQ